MDRYQGLAEEVAALLKSEHRAHLTLPDLFQLQRRGHISLPIDLTHLGCLFQLDRCERRRRDSLRRLSGGSSAGRVEPGPVDSFQRH